MKEKGEEVLHVRGSRKIYIPVYFMIFVLIMTMVAIKINGKEISTFTLKLVGAFIAACIIGTEVHRSGNWYEINSNALVVSTGILSRKTRRVDLVSVSDADSRQDVWQRLLNYGDVRARLFSKESTVLVKNINDPKGFSDFLEESMNKKKSGEGSPI